MRDVAVGEQDLVNVLVTKQPRQVGLRDDRDAVGIAGAGEFGREPAAVDAGNLRGGEGDDLDGRIVAQRDEEVVEVAPGRAHDDRSANAPLTLAVR